MSEEFFLNAFRRFSSRKSLPTTMISDNATTYMAAASHLKKLFSPPPYKKRYVTRAQNGDLYRNEHRSMADGGRD
ncbi:hypothetical protein DPMN_042736 [Dreissena polymorpha]|uniref:Integrase catalytic domain-containing protein n=1 Tax=Dreissena polymorpha TaxID=45954 RepID=A0A9D4D2K5_DREPO|nr:hypothetical protein DPMN_042736 [Dreissena polymorpha]